LGHQVQIVNTKDYNQVIKDVNSFESDFVHIHYDEFISLYPHIQQPKAITSHYGYLERPELFGGYVNIANEFASLRPNTFCLSEGIWNMYKVLFNIPENKLFLTPNGVNREKFKFVDTPEYPDRSIYLAKIDYRKRQFMFQSIPSIWYAGNVADGRFDTCKNYLGEWDKNTLYNDLTQYGNLVLLSDGEAHPLVCMEALSAGLGVVVCEWGRANLDASKEFITIIPENKISDLEYVENKIIENREYAVNNRKEIVEYSKQFDWKEILQRYYIPSIEKIIANS
jgi:glycosyltransferase involved in cell wall biosynthesis